MDESPYNDMAYCERFPRDYDPNNPRNDPSWPLYWAQVSAESGALHSAAYTRTYAHTHIYIRTH